MRKVFTLFCKNYVYCTCKWMCHKINSDIGLYAYTCIGANLHCTRVRYCFINVRAHGRHRLLTQAMIVGIICCRAWRRIGVQCITLFLFKTNRAVITRRYCADVAVSHRSAPDNPSVINTLEINPRSDFFAFTRR